MAKGSKPQWRVMVSRESNGKNYYTQIGSGWDLKDEMGVSIVLHALPVDGKLVMFVRKPDEQDE